MNLYVQRERVNHLNCVTTLRDNNGKVKAVLTGYNQPTKRKPSYTLRGQTFNLIFE